MYIGPLYDVMLKTGTITKDSSSHLASTPRKCLTLWPSEYALLISRRTPEENRIALYASLRAEYPKSAMIRRMPLLFTTGANFESRMDDYLRTSLQKGLDLRSIYVMYQESCRYFAIFASFTRILPR